MVDVPGMKFRFLGAVVMIDHEEGVSREASLTERIMIGRIAELEAALRGLVEAVKAGEPVSGAEAMGAAEAALANQQ